MEIVLLIVSIFLILGLAGLSQTTPPGHGTIKNDRPTGPRPGPQK